MTPESRDHQVTIFDTSYATRRSGSLLARIYQPDGSGPFPVVVEVHGGVWTAGSRTSNERIDRYLATNGIVVVAIDFRFPPEGRFPSSMLDVQEAIEWTIAHASSFNGAPACVGGLGFSSGGHQLLYTAMQPLAAGNQAHGKPQTRYRLDYLILCWPIVDPLARYRWALSTSRESLARRHLEYWQTESAMAEGSPQHLLENRTHDVLPPLLVLQGSLDENIPSHLVERFSHSYVSAGGQCAYVELQGQVHDFLRKDWTSKASTNVREMMVDFVRIHTSSI